MERAEEPTEKTGTKGSWYVIVSHAGRYIVRTQSTDAEVTAAHAAGKLLEIEEAFEFSSQLQIQQVPNPNNPMEPMMNIGKMNLAHRIDGTLFPVKARISLQGALVYNLNDLKEADAASYKDFITGAVNMANGWYQERVRAKTGIEVAPPGGFRGIGVPGLKV